MLKHHGYTVTILEQEVFNARAGHNAGVSLRGQVGIFLEAHDRVRRQMTIKSPPGINQALPQRGQTFTNTSWGLLYSVLRANFDGQTSKAVPIAPGSHEGDGLVEYKNGCRVTDLKELGERVQVQYENVSSGTFNSLSADLVLVADGVTSSTRRILLPDVNRKYAGYICWRGTVPEELVEEKWNQLYSEKLSIHINKNDYILMYTVPTDDGDFSPGKRLHNFCWYSTIPDGSPEMRDIFTDVKGVEHRGTLSRSLMRPDIWEKQSALAASVLPEGIASIVQKTPSPFACKIFHVASPKAQFFGGKVFLVGDGQTALKPNIGMSTSHAAHDCNRLEQVIEGKKTPEEWEKMVLRWSAAQRKYAEVIVSYGLGTKLQTLWNALSWLLLLLRQKLGLA